MKKKLSFLLLALVTVAAFAYKVTNRAVAELAVVSEATTWDFSTDVTSSLSTDLKYEGDEAKAEKIYANIAELTFAETFKADALAFTGQYPFRSNSKKFAQAGTLHFKTSVAGKIVVKFTDTGSSAAANAVKRYLLVNGEQTKYWTSRENNGTDAPYAAQLNVTTDEIDVPAGDVTITGSSAICVSYIKFTPNAAASTDDTLPLTLTFPTYNDKSVSNYTDEWTATVDGKVWTLNGFNNNKNGWSSVKCGRKGNAQTATITSPVINAEATNVVYTVSKTSNLESVMFTILNGDTEVSTTNITDKFVAGSVNVEVAGQKGYSYKLTVNSTEASANGTTEITKIAIYGNGQYVEKHIANTIDNPYTVAEAYELIDAGEALTETVFVKGIISQIDEKYFNAETGTIQYWISDDGTTTKQLEVYKGLGLDGAKFTSKDDLALGAKVIVTGKIKKYNTTYEFDEGNQLAKYIAPAVDVEISPESGDISAALATAIEGKNVGNITINLTKDAAYTISAPIVAPASLAINGNGATIDASALTAAMITTPAGDLADWMDGNLTIKDVTIKGVKKGIYASAGKNYLYNDFLIENSVIEIAATGGCEFDFRKGGVAKNFTINKSTIYAPEATANSMYTSQSAQRGTEAPGVTVQTFTITNSTLYNIAKSKNFFTHRQANQAWLAYTIKNSIFVNVGKSGQVVKGINQGQQGKNPTWSIDGNIFNYEGDDTSAAEDTGDTTEGENVQNSIAGIVTFENAAEGKFNGELGVATVPTTETVTVGDPRWKLTAKQVPFDIEISPAEGDIAAALATASAGKLVKDIKINLAADGVYTLGATLTVPNDLTIKGDASKPATITMGEGFSGNIITLNGTETAALKEDGTDSGHKLISSVEIKNVKILGVKGSLVRDEQKTLLEELTIDNAVIEMAASKQVINFQSKGYVGDLEMKNSTLYSSLEKHEQFFAQYGSRPKNVNANLLQKFEIENSTIYNIAQGKNVCDISQNGTAQNVYTLKNNVLVNCGKNGQTVVGFNKGQASKNPVWTVSGNIFNYGGEDTSAAETSKAGKLSSDDDIVQNSIAGIVTFEDAAAGKFNGNVELPYGVEKPAAQPGDARWTLTYTNAPQKFTVNLAAVENGTVSTDATGALAEGTLVTITATPNEGYELGAITVTGVYSNLAVVVTDGKFTMPADDVTVTVTFKVSTGIQNVSVENNSLENATFYDLNGRRVENPTKKGIYIVNGKKVVIK